MKVLVIYVNNFEYSSSQTSTENIDFISKAESFKDAILAFIQVEEKDEEKTAINRAKKLANHIKWAMRKNKTQNVILHSFAHLSESKALPEYTKDLLNNAEERLKSIGYKASQTPFAHFLNIKIDTPGFSLARIWADL